MDLPKGGNTTLGPPAPHRVSLGLAWQLDVSGGAPPELDAQVILLGQDGRVVPDAGLLFFSQLAAGAGTTAGATAGTSAGGTAGGVDVEQVVVDLARVPPEVDRIVVSVAIYAAAARGQSFRQVRGAAIAVADADTGAPLARYALDGDTGVETAMVFGELYRHRSAWKFRAVGQGYAGGLAAVARDYGVQV